MHPGRMKTFFTILILLIVIWFGILVICWNASMSKGNFLISSVRHIGHHTKHHTVSNTVNMATENSKSSIHELKENRELTFNSSSVYPGGIRSMSFEKHPQLPLFSRLPRSHHSSNKHRIHQRLNYELPDLSMKKNDSKLILFYNPPGWFRTKVLSHCNEGLQHCPVQSCKCSIHTADLELADTVIIDGVELNIETPMKKQSSQAWIFFTLENQYYFRNGIYRTHQWRQMFNWTMTYRLDSDIPIPYDILLHRRVSKNYTAIAQSKTKSAVWLVSNCRSTSSKREQFVRQLKKFYNVDIFGRCGNKTRLNVSTILKPYRFYLAFENSFCFDYMTEKLFKTYAADINVIPVVRGGGDYDTLIPSGTFINAAHYDTPEVLGKYLTYLERNVTAYAEFLERNDQFINEGNEKTFKYPFCDICVKSHDMKRYENWYTDIGEWFIDGTCTKVTSVMTQKGKNSL